MIAARQNCICFAFAVLLCLSGAQCNKPHTAPPTTAAPPNQEKAETWTVPAPQCDGGNHIADTPPSLSDVAMASQMKTAIQAWRKSQSLTQLPVNPASTSVTVAYWHAQDMNMHNYVSLIGSDGENITQHLACTHGPIQNGGAIVVGQSDNVTDVLNFMTNNPSAAGVLKLAGPSNERLVVGYCNGFWCILIY